MLLCELPTAPAIVRREHEQVADWSNASGGEGLLVDLLLAELFRHVRESNSFSGATGVAAMPTIAMDDSNEFEILPVLPERAFVVKARSFIRGAGVPPSYDFSEFRE